MKPTFLLNLALAAALCAGCSPSGGTTKTEAVHKHEHKPPHGGTPVELGDEEYHVELVRDAAAGKLQAFIFDGELETFVRIPAKSISVSAKVAGKEEPLLFHAVPNAATGETVGDTALFEARADWLKTTPEFEAVLREVTVRAKTYTNISFNFPKGTDEGGKK
jgi:hypothetical protein